MLKEYKNKRQLLIEWLIRHSYKVDKFGHYIKKIVAQGTMEILRYKMSNCSIRKEVKTNYGWVRLRSSYIKDTHFDEKDRLIGMKHTGCQIKDYAAHN